MSLTTETWKYIEHFFYHEDLEGYKKKEKNLHALQVLHGD